MHTLTQLVQSAQVLERQPGNLIIAESMRGSRANLGRSATLNSRRGSAAEPGAEALQGTLIGSVRGHGRRGQDQRRRGRHPAHFLRYRMVLGALGSKANQNRAPTQQRRQK